MRFLPHDDKFFDLMVNQAHLAVDASAQLVVVFGGEFIDHALVHQTADKLGSLELEGAELMRTITFRLHRSFITPIDPEDIQSFATSIDELIDSLEAIAFRSASYELPKPPRRAAELTLLVDKSVKALSSAVEELERSGVKKPAELSGGCRAIRERTREAEALARGAMRDLFREERDPVPLMQQKEIYQFLDAASQACRRAANVLEIIAVKNS